MNEPIPARERMQIQIDSWQATADRRVAFLNCYQLMTHNMLAAIDDNQFNDGEWIYSLLQQFAGYYFSALEAFNQNNPLTPKVWRRAFEAAQDSDTLILQNLLLGINAHINYDLIFTLVDMLEPDWRDLSPDERQGRFDDYTHVNQIIAGTIDTVQDTIIEPGSVTMELIDRLGGPVDEWIVSLMINEWRDEVWESAIALLDAREDERHALGRQYEQAALGRAARILLTRMDSD